jgi:hypothetical protein
MSANHFSEVEQFFARWMQKNEDIWRAEMRKLDIGDSQELYQSFHHTIRHLANGFLEGDQSFETHGRFVDMGVGRGRGKDDWEAGRLDDWGSGRKGRKAKPWYNKVLYGRINDLMGATGARIMEKAVSITRKSLLSKT